MKIFISGIAGFLGSHIADRMLEEGHEVIGCDNLIGGYLDNVPKDVKFYNYDLNNLNGLKDLLAGCDIVYHTAAQLTKPICILSKSYLPKYTADFSKFNYCSHSS